MKLPKKLYIAGKEWKVVKDPKTNGGFFDAKTGLLTIGTEMKDEIPINFMHETLECILTERMHRYSLPYDNDDPGNLIFVFNHEQLNQVSADLALALKDVLK